MTPKDLGYKMPPEWTRHACTFMEWPTTEDLWPGGLDEARQAYSEVARAIARFEPVIMIVRPELSAAAARLCGPAVHIHEMEHDDSWMRDNGPTFVVNAGGEVAGINWRFNAWGGKHERWEQDNLVAPRLLDYLKVPCFNAPLVLEGGSIHTDGEGTLLTTEECLLNQNRNPHLNKTEIEKILKQYLGVDKVIWLRRGLEGDETDGHVDNVACFARPGIVLVQSCSDSGDPNCEILQENMAILRGATDAKGRKLRVIPVEQPPATYYRGVRLPLSYINFYFVNGGIVMPRFGGACAAADDHAARILRSVFPKRKIVEINGLPIARGGGNVHCITQQMPAGMPEQVREVRYA
ncbi:agmatine deiminase [Desulfofundulus thermobenzoicus]|uniref:Putative agmatine deiminase n=2 Tax=Desulfofundulus thermobenzoicus TaxID=29376 RepID=A0A6N7IL87_9FIRM|nr:agmatine deiminase family protein [Desulfofundulus thermobenzoicus]MQL50740.1 agmatine deiminase [Desulfofundulus thermobenzoicus]